MKPPSLRLCLLAAIGCALAGCDGGFERMLTGSPTPTPEPVAVATPTPKPGAWMWEKNRRTLLDATPKKR